MSMSMSLISLPAWCKKHGIEQSQARSRSKKNPLPTSHGKIHADKKPPAEHYDEAELDAWLAKIGGADELGIRKNVLRPLQVEPGKLTEVISITDFCRKYGIPRPTFEGKAREILNLPSSIKKGQARNKRTIELYRECDLVIWFNRTCEISIERLKIKAEKQHIVKKTAEIKVSHPSPVNIRSVSVNDELIKVSHPSPVVFFDSLMGKQQREIIKSRLMLRRMLYKVSPKKTIRYRVQITGAFSE